MDSLILLHFQTLIKKMQSTPRLDKSSICLILRSIPWLIQVKELNQFRKSLPCSPIGTTRHKDGAEQQMERLFLSSAGFRTTRQTVTSWSRHSSAMGSAGSSPGMAKPVPDFHHPRRSLVRYPLSLLSPSESDFEWQQQKPLPETPLLPQLSRFRSQIPYL